MTLQGELFSGPRHEAVIAWRLGYLTLRVPEADLGGGLIRAGWVGAARDWPGLLALARPELLDQRCVIRVRVRGRQA